MQTVTLYSSPEYGVVPYISGLFCLFVGLFEMKTWCTSDRSSSKISCVQKHRAEIVCSPPLHYSPLNQEDQEMSTGD